MFRLRRRAVKGTRLKVVTIKSDAVSSSSVWINHFFLLMNRTLGNETVAEISRHSNSMLVLC
jgi:hypothetical protein